MRLDLSADAPLRISVAARTILSSGFILLIGLQVFFNVLFLGPLPVRGILGATILGLMVLVYWPLFIECFNRFRNVVLIIGIVAVVGLFASVTNGRPLGPTMRQIMEIHVQAFVFFMLTAMMVRLNGQRFVVVVIVGAIGISSVFAVLQYLQIDLAWMAREQIAILSGEVGGDIYDLIIEQERPMGLSFSPVVYATELCLAFGALWGLWFYQSNGKILDRIDSRLLIVAAVFVVVCFVSGNRSPILGMAWFMMFYLFATNRLFVVLSPIMALCIILLLPAALDILSNTDAETRVLSIDDRSAVGRVVLREYGMLLFLDRPLGYGLDFNSIDYWPAYWSRLQDYDNAVIIQIHTLHNYLWQTLNKYGFPMILVGAYVATILVRQWRVALGFIVYGTHIWFHNTGPFQAEPLFWLILPTLPYFVAPRAKRHEAAAPPSAVPAPA